MDTQQYLQDYALQSGKSDDMEVCHHESSFWGGQGRGLLRPPNNERQRARACDQEARTGMARHEQASSL